MSRPFGIVEIQCYEANYSNHLSDREDHFVMQHTAAPE